MIKKIALVFGLLFAITGYGQKIAFVNTQQILDMMPEYKSAQEKLNELSKQYEVELKTKKEEINQMYASYQADKILLSEELRTQREDQIKKAEAELQQLTEDRYGANGDLYKERQKLIKPIQDKVYQAIKDYSESKNYAFVVDISSDIGILYYNSKYDETDEVLKKLGY